jgi:LysM repeat protein
MNLKKYRLVPAKWEGGGNMLHIVKNNDTLYGIAQLYMTTIDSILAANVICNPNYIFVGMPLIIPEPNLALPKAGGTPYFVLNYGDTLWCLANQFSQSIESILAANQITNANQIDAGSELLVGINVPNANELYDAWNISKEQCELLNSAGLFGVFYLGSFQWEALGEGALPYLRRLLNHSCNLVRFHVVMSLGRIGRGTAVYRALQKALQDPDQEVSTLASLAIKRFQLIPTWTKRIHVTTSEVQFLQTLSSDTPSRTLPRGTPIFVLRWNIPSPTGEVSPPGSLDTFEYVQIQESGETGYIRRAGYGAIQFI